jgi:mannose/cellobiose epimerase-like protein (N-acyl-D-glucosamine 2-epimerase family)
MTLPADTDPRELLPTLHAKLKDWLIDAAYPLWSSRGIDRKSGGFIETLAQDGSSLAQPCRARLYPRQAYAFAQAPRFGWRGDASGIVSRGMDYFSRYYLRGDGLFRTLVDVEGIALDNRAWLYDQAFALLGFAAAATALDSRGPLEHRALQLRSAIEDQLRAADGSYCTGDTSSVGRESNPHMHLLEACLAWADIGKDPGWAEWVRNVVDLALARFIRKDNGALGESYTADWQAAPGLAGRIIEPGHQFEWAWLLLRCEPWCAVPVRETALQLIDIGEGRGVQRGVAVNQLLDDFSVHDAGARFWPQTERLKAALLAARLTGEAQYWSMALAATTSFFPYIDTPIPGLWYDLHLANGAMVDSPAPASTFYHLVGAISALDSSLR